MTKMRQLWAITVVLVLAVLAAGWFLLVAPKHSHAAALRAQTATQHSNSAALRVQLAQLQAQAKNLPAQQAALRKIALQIPENPALPTLIRSLSAMSSATDTTLVSLKPSAPAAAVLATGAVTVPAGSASKAAPAQAGLQTIAMSIQIDGSYFGLVQLVSELERLPRVFMVDGFQLTPQTATGGSDSTTSGSSGLSLNLTGRVFMAPPTPVQPVQTGATAATTSPASPTTTAR